jgi:hypothetical protein
MKLAFFNVSRTCSAFSWPFTGIAGAPLIVGNMSKAIAPPLASRPSIARANTEPVSRMSRRKFAQKTSLLRWFSR